MAEDPKLMLLGKNLFLETLLGNQLFWERLLENLFLRALFLLGTLLGNGSCNLAWEPLLEPYLQAIPGKRTLLGSLFLDTVYLFGNLFLKTYLGTSSWEGREHQELGRINY